MSAKKLPVYRWSVLMILLHLLLTASATDAVVIVLSRVGSGSDTVFSAGQEWMDRNLGASRTALNLRDLDSFGTYFQWGRLDDGHAFEMSTTTTVLSAMDEPGHGGFILTSSIPFDWRSPKNDNLWQGAKGINNPCPNGFRLATKQRGQIYFTAFSSSLALGLISLLYTFSLT